MIYQHRRPLGYPLQRDRGISEGSPRQIIRDSRILAGLWEITTLSLQESKHAADEELSKLY